MKIGVDLDDVMAVCAEPYLKRFAQHFGITLPDREIGWQLLDGMDGQVSAELRDQFRIMLYDGPFFGELEPYPDCPPALGAIAAAGHEVHFITARNERRRPITEEWLRRYDLLKYAKGLHLRPRGDFAPTRVRGRYDASGSAVYKVRAAKQLALDAFCEDDELIAHRLAEAGVRVWLFDHPWNRDLVHPNIERVSDWSGVTRAIGLA